MVDEAAATAMEKALDPSTFKTTLKEKVAAATSIDISKITVELEKPEAKDITPKKKGVVSSSTILSPGLFSIMILIALNIFL